MPQLVEPLPKTKSDYRICAEVAERLANGEAYTQGHDERGWVEWELGEYRQLRFPELPSLGQLLESNAGVYSSQVEQPAIVFADFRADPVAHPLHTPSVRIEIFSQKLCEMHRPEEITAIPKYIQEWESPFSSETQENPSQAICHHTIARMHSKHANNNWLDVAFSQEFYKYIINTKARCIQDGEMLKLYNGCGALTLLCKITLRILPWVVDIPQGSSWAPDIQDPDNGGNVNILTSKRWTPLAFTSAQHTTMVEVMKHS